MSSAVPPDIDEGLCSPSQRYSANGATRKKPQASVTVISTLGLAVFAFGTIGIFLINYTNFIVAARCSDPNDPDCSPARFAAPHLQQVMQALGELFCMVISLTDRGIARLQNRPGGRLEFIAEEEKVAKTHAQPWQWIIPAMCDVIGGTFLLYAYSVCGAGVVQVLRNFSILCIAFLSVVWLRRDLPMHAWIGCMITAIGLAFTSVGASHQTWNVNPAAGVTCALIGTAMNAIELVFEEKLWNRHWAAPFEAVGWIGVFATILSFASLFISNIAGKEKIHVTLYQATHDTGVGICLICLAVSIVGLNVGALYLTKISTALLTATLLSLRQIPLFIADQVRQRAFEPLGCLGMIMVTLGFFLYVNYTPLNYFSSIASFLRKNLVMRIRILNPGEYDIYSESFYSDEGDAETPEVDQVVSDGGNHAVDFGVTNAREDISQETRALAHRTEYRRRSTDQAKIMLTANEAEFFKEDNNAWIYVERDAEFYVDQYGNRIPATPRS